MIKVKNLFKSFEQDGKKINVLNGINLDFKKGERVALLGPSGGGKSTFLRCLNLLEIPSSGDIEFEGKSILNGKQDINEVRKNIGMVFQHFNLFPHLKILENIILAPVSLKLYTKEEASEKALSLLEKVGLKDKAYSYPSRLSGGQKQRVAIVRSLIMDPKVMLFDEPTSALDPEMIKEVTSVMIDIADRGMTMIVVTHEMNFVKKVATRVVFMEKGKVAADETPENIFKNSETTRINEFLNKLS